jgi:hypothetical protein
MHRVKFLLILGALVCAVSLSLTNARASSAPPPRDDPSLKFDIANTFVVTKTGDSGINNTPVVGTLRWAMQQANASAGHDLIRFDISGSGVQTINVKDWLPDLTDNAGVTIDGTQSDDRIEINTANANIYHYGIAIYSSNNVIKGLVINNTPGGSAAIGIDKGGSYNVIIGNYLGTNPAGTAAKGAWEGIKIGPGSHDNVIGGTNGVTPGGACTGDCNLISGNRAHGVVIDHADNNKVIGNFIGVNVSGTAALPNADDGVLIANSQNNIVGGSTPPERNVIAGNGNINFEIGQNDRPTRNNLIKGNYLGTNSAGTAALGSSAVGVLLGTGSSDTMVDSNLISGINGTGVLILKSSNRNTIINNYIGVAGDGRTVLRNNIGVLIQTNGNQILNNIIANSSSDGIRVKSGTGNLLRGNSTYNNAKLGINLAVDGFTPNDPGDGDSGPNMLQNFPVLSSANASGGTLTVKGSLNSRPNARFTIDLYQNPVCDNTYNRNVGQGKTYLGSVDVSTDGGGNVSFTASLNTSINSGIVVGTATDASGNTSEFSECRAIASVAPPPPPPQLLSPSNGATITNNPPPLSWNASNGAASYTIQIRQDSTGGTKILTKKNLTDLTFTPPALDVGHTYYWQVKACNQDQKCSKSVWFSFTIPAPAPPSKPQLLNPQNGTTPSQNPPKLSWNASENAVRYVVVIRQDSKKGPTVDLNKNVTTTSYTPPALPGGHTYFWRVRACNAENQCVASVWFSFILQ